MREKQRARRKEKERKQTRTKVNEKNKRKKHRATAHIRKDRCGKANLDQSWRPIRPKAAAHIRKDKGSNTRRGANRRKRPDKKGIREEKENTERNADTDQTKEEEAGKRKDKRKHKKGRGGVRTNPPPKKKSEGELKQAQVCKTRNEHARCQQLNFHKSTIGIEARAHLKGEPRQVKLTIARQCSKTPPQGHLGPQSHGPHSQRQVWQGPKVATCEARFCKISATFGFLAHFGAETTPSKPVQAKAILDKVAKTRETTRSSRQRRP